MTERFTVGLPAALYDLPNDISENNDLAPTEPDDVARLQQLFAQWENTTMIAPVWQYAQFPTDPLVMVGDWNGFDIKSDAPPWSLVRTTAPADAGTPDAFTWFTTTVHVATTGGDTKPGAHTFVVAGDKTYTTQWGGVTINIDGGSAMQYFTGNNLGRRPDTRAGFPNDYQSTCRRDGERG